MDRPLLTRRTLLTGLAASLAVPAFAQLDRPVRFILPNATGSGVDAITRAAQPALAKAFGRPVIVDNQPGAGGMLGLQALTRAAPDGLTLGIVSNNVVIFPSVMKSLPFDMPGDFTPIAVVGYTPVVLVVNPKVPAKDAKEFVALLKSRRRRHDFRIGRQRHHPAPRERDVPRRGRGEGEAHSLQGRRSDGDRPDRRAGRFRHRRAAERAGPYQVAARCARSASLTAQRVAAAPEIPTFAEQGMPNYVVEAWFAVIGPKGLARRSAAVHEAVVAAFGDAEVKEAMARQGNVINVGAPDKARPFFRNELAKYAQIVKKAGIEAQ